MNASMKRYLTTAAALAALMGGAPLSADTPIPVPAQPAAATGRTAAAASITLGQAREAAIARSPDVIQAQAELRALGWDEKSSFAAFLPSVTASAGISGSIADDNSVTTAPSFGVTASQTLFSGLSRLTAYRSAKASTAKGEEALRSARLTVIEETDTRFLDALETARSYETAQKNLEAAQKSLDIAKAKKDVGTLSQSDFLEVQSTWATKKTAEVQAKYAAATSARKLSSYIGTSAAPVPLDDGEINALASFVRERAEADLDGFVKALYAASRDKNPDIRQQELAAEIARLSIVSARSDFFPSLSVSASYKKTSNDFSSAYTDSKSFSVSASIPLFPLVDTYASVKAAQENAASSRSALASAEDDLLLNLYTDSLSVLSAAGQIESADAAVAYAEGNYKLALEQFRLSAGTISSLTTAEATLVSARAQAITSRFDLYAALTALVRLSGAETEQGFRDAVR